jgi:hypothetical protein
VFSHSSIKHNIWASMSLLQLNSKSEATLGAQAQYYISLQSNSYHWPLSSLSLNSFPKSINK